MRRADWERRLLAIRFMAPAAARCSCIVGGLWSRVGPNRRLMLSHQCRTHSGFGWTSSMRPDDVEIPEDALSEKFLAATGPGGQNVNKVATACQLRADVFKLGLSPEAYAKLKVIAGSRMTTGGELIITARRFRTQESNREDARSRLAEMIAAAHIVQAKRRPTRPSRSAKAKRVDEKKGRSAVKAGRGRVTDY